MPDRPGILFTVPRLRMRDAGIPSTRVTNELADALNNIVPLIHGQAEETPAVAREVWVKLTGTLTGRGKYNGRILTPPDAAIDDTAAVTAADFGAAPANDNCVVYNDAEIGLTSTTTHAIDTTQSNVVFPGLLVRFKTDGTPVIGINAFQIKLCP